jgi:hypothetical protein
MIQTVIDGRGFALYSACLSALEEDGSGTTPALHV